LISDQKVAVALDFDFDGGNIYWSEITSETIQRAEVKNGSDVEVIIKEDLSMPEGIAVDWINKKLYWTDSGTLRIEVADLNGENRLSLVQSGLLKPRAIAVHPFIGYMFWTDWGDKSKIEKCGMNGEPKSRQVIVNKNIVWPNGLTIDYTLNRIWWTDAKPGLSDTIESADLNGNHRRIVLKSGSLEHPFGISLFQDNVYWTDRESGKLFRTNKFTGGEEVELAVNLRDVMNVAVFHQQRQPSGKNPCNVTAEVGRCSHICLLAPVGLYPEGFTCHCPPEVVLLADQKTCGTPAQGANSQDQQ